MVFPWAYKNWDIVHKWQYDEYMSTETLPDGRVKKNKNRYLVEQRCPAYRPVTVVGHSQGSACATGVAIGIMYYVAERGWKQIALNITHLSSNQPRNLTGERYEELIDRKKTSMKSIRTLLLLLLRAKSLIRVTC